MSMAEQREQRDKGEERKGTRWRQSRLVEFSAEAETCRYTNIEPQGDKLRQRKEGDGIIRVGFQNIRGTSLTSGLEVPYEIDAMDDLGIDIQGFAETNRPWTAGNKAKYNHMMTARFQGSRTFYSSAPSSHDCKYTNQGARC